MKKYAVLVSSICMVLAWMLRAGAAPAPATRPAAAIDFNRDIRPILSENCFACHGPDKNKRKADPPLRLDTQDGLFGERDGTHPVAPGKPEDSVLYMRITSDDAEFHMPEKASNKTLSKAQIETLRRWIEQGAPWKGHWAYIPPTRPAVPNPEINRDGSYLISFVRNDIDRFILQTLNDKGLHPAQDADKITLVRRLYLDLVGLPPTPEQVEAFVNNPRADAYERLVSDLLANPHFGERMAVYWLDLVRYADSIGYHSDNSRDVWPYRDWVIRAFNEGKPFDQFTVEQLAGDLLPNPTEQQKVASAYNRLLETTEEGGAQPKEYEAKSAADRVRNVSAAWLGSTMACCQCHDHKFDPFTQKDFYQMAAFFADIKEPPIGKLAADLLLPNEAQAKQLKDFEQKVAAISVKLNTPTKELASAQRDWEESFRGVNPTHWTILRPEAVASKSGAMLRIEKNGVIVAAGNNPPTDTYTITAKTDLKGITAFRLEVLPDKALVKSGPGRAGNGNFVLTKFTAEQGAAPTTRPIALQNATASHEQAADFTAALSIDPKKKDPKHGWAILERLGQANYAVFETAADLGKGGPKTLTFRLEQNWGEQHTIGRLRLSATNDQRPVRADRQPPSEVRDILLIDAEERTPEAKEKIAAYYRSIAPLLDADRAELAKQQQAQAEFIAQVSKTLISIPTQPRTVRVLARGNWQDESGEVVLPDVPGFLKKVAPIAAPPATQAVASAAKEAVLPTTRPRLTRLDLAHWIVSRDNPLTARVFVNRLWKLFYGQGLARPLDDIGSQSDAPTHAELLDWLACEFIDSGWNVKHIVRLMATSGTYRQSSTADRTIVQQDPYNKYVARQNAFRLDAEFVRDNALAVSGLLAPTIGGPSVRPYQPEGYWDFLNFPKRTYQADKGDSQYRRGLYTHWQRTFLHPSLVNFDAPSREECVAQRSQSNTPQQALTLLNDPTYVEAARVFAARICNEGGATPGEKIRWAYRRALCRDPQPGEIPILTQLFEKHHATYATTRPTAEKLTSVGEAPPAKNVDPADVAAWTSVARTILNLHEAITRN